MARKKKSLELSDAAGEVLKPALSWMRGAESSSTAEQPKGPAQGVSRPVQGGEVRFPSTAEPSVEQLLQSVTRERDALEVRVSELEQQVAKHKALRRRRR